MSEPELITLEVTDSGPVWYAEEKRWLRRGDQITVPQRDYKRWCGVCKKLIAGTIPDAKPPFPRTPPVPVAPTLREKVAAAGTAVLDSLTGKSKKEAPASTEPLACPHCGQEFKTQAWLDKHLKNAHPAPAEETPAEEG